MKSKILGLLVVGLLAGPMTASAAFYSDESTFTSTYAGLKLLDFEGVCGVVTCDVPTYDGLTISGPFPAIADGPTYNVPSDWLTDERGGEFLNLAFAPAIDAVGFRVSAGFWGGLATIDLFDGATLLDSQTVDTAALRSFNTFVGWGGLGSLNNVRISVSFFANPDLPAVWANIDDLRFRTTSVPVPEPGTLALLGLGLLGLGVSRRKV